MNEAMVAAVGLLGGAWLGYALACYLHRGLESKSQQEAAEALRGMAEGFAEKEERLRTDLDRLLEELKEAQAGRLENLEAERAALWSYVQSMPGQQENRAEPDLRVPEDARNLQERTEDVGEFDQQAEALMREGFSREEAEAYLNDSNMAPPDFKSRIDRIVGEAMGAELGLPREG